MGRPPSNGGPSFRFNPTEVAEMEGILQAHNCLVPQREVLVALAEKFSNSAERSGKPAVQMKQVWNWFQNRRYALRAKSAKPPAKLNVSPMPQHDLAAARNVPQAPQNPSAPAANLRSVPQVPQHVPTPTVQSAGRNGSDNPQMEFEAKSARDGAWYDVATFLSHRSLETSDPEVLVRFAGFGPEEDEWVNVRKHVRQRSLPCESSECVAVLPGDLILCFQEGKEQALYFDAHVLDAQRRRHDVRGCRCRFLVRYDHDQSEEIVPLRKVCRRPETDYRMQQLHAESANTKQNKISSEPHNGNDMKAYPPAEATLKQPKVEGPAETIPKLANAEVHADTGSLPAPVSHANVPETIASATAPSPHSNVSIAPSLAPDANPGIPGATIMAPVASSLPVAPPANPGIPGATIMAPVASSVSAAPPASPVIPEATILAPVASSLPVAPPATPIANSSVHGATVATPVASSVPVAPDVAPHAAPIVNSSVPVAAPVASPLPAALDVTLVANYNPPRATVLAPVASNVPVAPTLAPVANSSVPVATILTPVASSVPVAPTMAPVADSSVPGATIVAPSASNVPVVPAVTPDADSSVPIVSKVDLAASSSGDISPIAAPPANSSIPIVPTIAPAVVSNISIASTTEDSVANSSVPVVPNTAPAVIYNVHIASTTEDPVANSSVPVAITAEAPVATNSSIPGATAEAPVAPNDVPAVTEFKDSLDKVSESGPADNVDNTNTQSSNLAIASGTDTSAVSEEGPGESMQLG